MNTDARESGGDIPLSITVPTYNRGAAVRALVEAIQAQAKHQDEIIIADDGSTDGTPDEASKTPGIRVLRQSKNQGMVANWNVCLRAATRDWICIIHDDDCLAPNALALLRRACALAREPALILHQYSGKQLDNVFRCRFSAPGAWAVLNCPTVPSGAIVHRKIINAVGNFDNRFGYSSDLEYFARIAAKFPLVIIENPSIVEYRIHSANYQFSTWRQADFYQQFEELQRAILAHAGIADGLQGREILEARLVDNFSYMLNLADRLGDGKLVRLIAENLGRFRHRLTSKQKIMLYAAANTGWRPKWRPKERLQSLV